MDTSEDITRNERPPSSPPRPRPCVLALMVDDSPADVMIIRQLFSILRPPFELIHEYGGRAGVARAKAEQPAFILLDLNLAPITGHASPVIDGLEVIRELRHNETTRQIPILVLSGSDRDEDRRAAREAGANAYRVKPSTLRAGHELAQSIAAWYWGGAPHE